MSTKSITTRRVRRRRCKFIGGWLLNRQFKRWLTPVRGDNHKAYCALCEKIFSVAHGGLHDVRAHFKGKRHISFEVANSQSQRAQRIARLADSGSRNPCTTHSSYRNRRLLLGRVEPDDVEYCEQVFFLLLYSLLKPRPCSHCLNIDNTKNARLLLRLPAERQKPSNRDIQTTPKPFPFFVIEISNVIFLIKKFLN